MSTARRRRPAGVVMVLLAGCATGSDASSPSLPGGGTTATVADQSEPGASATAPIASPSFEDARAVALRWVAATGELLKMGPIARSELIRNRVASASSPTMGENLQDDLANLADHLPVPPTELRLVETPITIDVSIESATGQARAHVWSVVVFGAKDLGAPRMVFRTSQLVLVVEAGEWRLASFTSAEGPTPIATDALPSDWDSFAVVAGWPTAGGGPG